MPTKPQLEKKIEELEKFSGLMAIENDKLKEEIERLRDLAGEAPEGRPCYDELHELNAKQAQRIEEAGQELRIANHALTEARKELQVAERRLDIVLRISDTMMTGRGELEQRLASLEDYLNTL